MFGHIQALGSIAESSLVASDAPTISDLRNRLMVWLAEVVEQQCADLENLQDITDLRYNRSQLDDLRADLSKMSLPHLVSRVDQAAQILKTRGDELQANAQESSLRSSIKAMKPDVPLKTLYLYQTSLLDITSEADETLRLRDEHLASIDNEIKQLEAFAAGAESELQQDVGRDGFNRFREKIRGIGWRFVDSSYQEIIQRVRERVEQLCGFYDEVAQVLSRRLNTADEARAAKNQINSVGRKYLNVVGEQQYAFAREAQANIDEYVQKQEQLALRWLEEQRAQYAAGKNLPQLRSQLEDPPGFFPDSESAYINDLIKSVDQRLDENVIEQVEYHFLRIKDQKVRRKCVARLQELLDEKAE